MSVLEPLITQSKILIIDDEPLLRQAIAEGLRAEKFEVFEASDGQRGLEIARNQLPDLIISDVNMSGMDGYDTLTSLRTEKATSSIPFILMTGRADFKGMRLGMSLGADDYLPKPFRLSELIEVVNTRLRRQASLREEADRRLSELRTNISMMLPHELLTPLTGIIGIAEMISSCPDSFQPAELHEFGRDIRLSGLRLHRLITNFLIYAQIEMTSSQPDRIRVLRNVSTSAIHGLIGDAALRKSIENNRQADLVLDLQPCNAAISDQHLLKIIEELADNAFKFSHKGTPVEIRCQSFNTSTEITIRDTGRGMRPEHVESIGAYVQFDRRIYEQQGSGLGLAIVTRMIDLHGGTINFESAPNAGTFIKIHIPVSPQPVPAATETN